MQSEAKAENDQPCAQIFGAVCGFGERVDDQKRLADANDQLGQPLGEGVVDDAQLAGGVTDNHQQKQAGDDIDES